MKNYYLGMGASPKSMFKSRVMKHLIPHMTKQQLKPLTIGSGVQRRASDFDIEDSINFENRVPMEGEGVQKRKAKHAPLKFKF
jgi:hypothetical protein